MSETAKTEKKKRAGRSPGYPAIDIQTALERATKLYGQAHHHASNIDIAGKHWGWSPGSGLTAVTIAALKKYGLIIDEDSGKDRTIRLTELALDILKDTREDQTERNENICKAALKPKIHKEMYDKYGENLPSDADLWFDLHRKKAFTEKGAKDFISQYKRTLSFVSNIKSDIIPPENGGKGQEEEEIKPLFVPPSIGGSKPPAPPQGENMKNIEIPTPFDPWPVLTVRFPMSEEMWDQMTKMLETMKPALVKAEKKAQAGELLEKMGTSKDQNPR